MDGVRLLLELQSFLQVKLLLFYGPEQAELSKLFPGVVNEVPDPLFILISASALIILWVVTFDKMSITDLKNGLITGIWFGTLTFTFFGFQFMALTNIVSIQFALTDIFISAIMGAVQGGAIGGSLGRFA